MSSLSDLFRGFFGFPRSRRPRDPFFGGITRDEDEDEDGEDGGPWHGAWRPEEFGPPFGGRRFCDSFGFDEFFCDFKELFSELEARGPSFELPNIKALPPNLGHLSEEKRQTLRDSMLKYPDSRGPRISSEGPDPRNNLGDGADQAAPDRGMWQPSAGLREVQPAPPCAKEDRDLDSQVSLEGLETILRPSEPRARSYFRSVSVTMVTGPDGTVEERRTVQDSQGHKETVVTRRRGDQTFVTTTKEREQGEDCQEEISLDDGQLAQFAGDWQQPWGLRMSDLGDLFLETFFRGWFSSR
uniref:HCLS1 associated protein X-1 n=1 Tax=Pelusios castaneus TaxID=367368 RepID=A0A8C8VG78_9SAUR